MQNNPNKVQNPGYLWACRIAAWVAVLFNIPLCIFNNYESGSIASAILPIILYCYLAVGSYVLGYRLDNPPPCASGAAAGLPARAAGQCPRKYDGVISVPTASI
jgi:hypothetical protein